MLAFAASTFYFNRWLYRRYFVGKQSSVDILSKLRKLPFYFDTANKYSLLWSRSIVHTTLTKYYADILDDDDEVVVKETGEKVKKKRTPDYVFYHRVSSGCNNNKYMNIICGRRDVDDIEWLEKLGGKIYDRGVAQVRIIGQDVEIVSVLSRNEALRHCISNEPKSLAALYPIGKGGESHWAKDTILLIQDKEEKKMKIVIDAVKSSNKLFNIIVMIIEKECLKDQVTLEDLNKRKKISEELVRDKRIKGAIKILPDGKICKYTSFSNETEEYSLSKKEIATFDAFVFNPIINAIFREI